MSEIPAEPSPADFAALAEAWPTPPPPDDFIERVLQARARRRRARPLVIAASALLGLGAAALLLLILRPQAATGRGTLTATGRTTLAIGERARAVAEAGTTLRYEVAPSGRVQVSQDSGSVFYRVDRVSGARGEGSDFVVRTPSAEVRVTGTCFRVDVTAEHAAVSVLEGTVLVKDGRGETALAAGESSTSVAAAEKFTDLTRQEWAALARRCAVRMQLPPYTPALRLLGDDEVARLGFGPAERAAYDQELQQFAADQLAALVRLHRVLAAGLGSPHAVPRADRSYVELDAEIRAQVPPAALAAARRRYAEARAAGAPLPDPATLAGLDGPVDRYVDLHASASLRFEARLAARLGAAKARAARDRPGVLRLGAEGCTPSEASKPSGQ